MDSFYGEHQPRHKAERTTPDQFKMFPDTQYLSKGIAEKSMNESTTTMSDDQSHDTFQATPESADSAPVQRDFDYGAQVTFGKPRTGPPSCK